MEISVLKQALINLGDEVFVRFSLFDSNEEISFDVPKGVLVEIAPGNRADTFNNESITDTFSIPVDKSFDFVKQLMPFYDVVKALLSEQIGEWTQDGNQLGINLVAHWTLGKYEIKQALNDFSKSYHAFIQNKEVK